jgi:hypothetical protein
MDKENNLYLLYYIKLVITYMEYYSAIKKNEIYHLQEMYGKEIIILSDITQTEKVK